MPIYKFECIECGHLEHTRLPLAMRNYERSCGFCLGETRRVFTPAHVAPVPGISNRIGREIEGE